jgi:hypothetical protein
LLFIPSFDTITAFRLTASEVCIRVGSALRCVLEAMGGRLVSWVDGGKNEWFWTDVV